MSPGCLPSSTSRPLLAFCAIGVRAEEETSSGNTRAFPCKWLLLPGKERTGPPLSAPVGLPLKAPLKLGLVFEKAARELAGAGAEESRVEATAHLGFQAQCQMSLALQSLLCPGSACAWSVTFPPWSCLGGCRGWRSTGSQPEQSVFGCDARRGGTHCSPFLPWG